MLNCTDMASMCRGGGKSVSLPEMVARRRVEEAEAEVRDAEQEIRQAEDAHQAQDESLDQVSLKCSSQAVTTSTTACVLRA